MPIRVTDRTLRAALQKLFPPWFLRTPLTLTIEYSSLGLVAYQDVSSTTGWRCALSVHSVPSGLCRLLRAIRLPLPEKLDVLIWLHIMPRFRSLIWASLSRFPSASH